MRAKYAREIREGIWFARHCAHATTGSTLMRRYYFILGTKDMSRTARRAAKRRLAL